KWTWDAEAIEAGLALYLVCSHNDRPLLGLISLSKMSAPVSSSNWAEDLRNNQKVSDIVPPTPPQLAGLAWGGAMWEIRQALGREAVDRVIIGAWRGLNVCQEGPVAAEFTSRFLSALRPDDQRKVKSILRGR